jgi:outer membrane protein, heavy metal efflux system
VPDLNVGVRSRNELTNGDGNRLGGRLQMDLPLFDRNQGGIAESAAEIAISAARHDALEVNTLSDVSSLYLSLQQFQSNADYYRQHVRPLMEQTEAAIRAAFQDRAVNAYELAELLQTAARIRLDDLEIRYQHQRLRARLELLLEREFPTISEDAPLAIPGK